MAVTVKRDGGCAKTAKKCRNILKKWKVVHLSYNQSMKRMAYSLIFVILWHFLASWRPLVITLFIELCVARSRLSRLFQLPMESFSFKSAAHCINNEMRHCSSALCIAGPLRRIAATKLHLFAKSQMEIGQNMFSGVLGSKSQRAL